ncbi:ornithine cyclodeaminase family protein, partial [Burkholderia sp. Ac-20379]|nr:ornithine cyclodeaminase family protein [Burkholderia sp. Ac-20379]
MYSLDSDALTRLLPFPSLIDALREAFVAGGHVPLRHVHTIGEGSDAGTSLLMPAWDDSGRYGVKIVNIYPGNRARGLPGLHSTYTLFDGGTGAPIAMLDGDVITSRRTAAAAALGASYLARADATRLVVAGAGRVGSLVGPAMAAVRKLDHLAVWDLDAQAAARCAATW